ncbi:phosphotransferase family protein [Streptomyces sp. NPDC016566]|uniref:phosphotransferase family protein n=1 Tax=Streptomyces sp. NPDC016566 TaxID=3364967 RepID=UPI0036FFB9A5
MTDTIPTHSAMRGLSALLGPRLQPVLSACQPHTGSISRIEACTGGNVSHVFRVHGDNGRVIVKVRGHRFARIRHLTTDPALIALEHRALTLYHRALPDLFPQVLAFLPDAHAMVMTDVFPDGRTWREHLDERPADVEECARLGYALTRIHHATTGLPPVREGDGDDRFRKEHAYGFCLRTAGHLVLTDVCRRLDTLPGQQLVLGDVCPKNLSLASRRAAFVDLDNVHRGSPLYDVGYLLAHLVLHHLTRPATQHKVVAAFLDAYTLPGPNRLWRSDALLAAVTAGVLLYRLETRVVPYPPTAPPATTDRFRRQILHLLDAGPFTVADLLSAAEPRGKA